MNRDSPLVRKFSNKQILLESHEQEHRQNKFPLIAEPSSSNLLGLSIENRMSSCEQGLRFLIEETMRTKYSLDSQLRALNQERESSIQETNSLRSQLINTQKQVAALSHHGQRTILMENEWDRIRNSTGEMSNIIHLEQSLSKVLVEVRELSLRLNQYQQLYENQKESSSKGIQQNEFAIKKLESSFAQASNLLSKSKESVDSQLRDISSNCSQDHHNIRSSIVARFDKAQEDTNYLSRNFQVEISQINQTLSNLEENLKEVLYTTSTKILNLQHLESKERETSEKRMQSLNTNIKNELYSKIEKLDQNLSKQVHLIHDSNKKLSIYLAELQRSSDILEKEIEVNKQQIENVLKVEIEARKNADIEIIEQFKQTHSDHVKLINGAHQGNRVTEAKLTKYQVEIEAMKQSIEEYHIQSLQSVNEISTIKGVFLNEFSTSESFETLKQSFEKFKIELKEDFETLRHQIESLSISQTTIKSDISLVANKFLLAKEDNLKHIEQTRVDLNQDRDSINQLENVIRPLLILPNVSTNLSKGIQDIHSKLQLDEEEMIQLHRSLTQLEKHIDEKLRLESVARTSALTNVNRILQGFQSLQNSQPSPSTPNIYISQPSFQYSDKQQVQQINKSSITFNPQQVDRAFLPSPPPRGSTRPNLYTSFSLQTKISPTSVETPPLKPNSLHIPKLSEQSSFNTYYTSSISLPPTLQRTTLSDISFPMVPTTAIEHSTPYSYSTEKISFPKNIYYSKSPIMGEMRVVSSVRSQNPEVLGSFASVARNMSSSDDNSPESIADKFEAIPEEDENISPNEDYTSEITSPERLLSVIREESETNSINVNYSEVSTKLPSNEVFTKDAKQWSKSGTEKLRQAYTLDSANIDTALAYSINSGKDKPIPDKSHDLIEDFSSVYNTQLDDDMITTSLISSAKKHSENQDKVILDIDNLRSLEESHTLRMNQPTCLEFELNPQITLQPKQGEVSNESKSKKNDGPHLIFSSQDSVISLPGEHPRREFKRMRTVDSVARQSFVNLTEALISIDDYEGLNEWGVYQALFWLRLKNLLLKPVIRLREAKRNELASI